MTHVLTTRPKAAYSVRLLSVLLALLCSFGAVRAQTLGAALSVASSGAIAPELQLRGLALESVTFDLRAAFPLEGAPSGGFAARTRTSFGPLGTVALVGRADASVAGAFDLGVSATGALAQWGFDGALGVFNRNPGALAPLAAFDLTARPFLKPAALAGGAFDLTIGLTRRLTRTTLLELRPAAYLTGVGAGGRLEGALQLRRLIGNDTGAVLLLTAVAPEGGRFGAAGFEYRLSRAGLPPLSAALLLGVDETGVQPGLRASVSGEAQGLRYHATLSTEPYRTDAPPHRAAVSVSAALGGGSAALELGAAPSNPFGGPPLLLRATYTFDL